MRRRRHSIDHNDQVRLVRRDFSPRPQRKRVSWWKIVLFSFVAVFIGMIAYVLSSAYSSANDALSQNITFKDIISRSSLKQTDGVTNVLVLGKGGANHPGGQLTDTIILARIKNDDKQVALISIPRDMIASIPGVGDRKINEAYTAGWNSVKDQKDTNKKAEAGANMAAQVVEKIAGVPVHYYITADFSGFKELVDILGGVTVDVDQDLYDPLYPKDMFTKDGQYVKTDAYTTFSLKKGRQTLDGETALKYARSRETTSDFDRAKRQQKIIIAIRDKAISLGVLSNPKKISELMSSLGAHIKTNMSLSELKSFIEMVQGVNKEKIINKVIDNGTGGLLVSSSEGFYHLVPKTGNYKEIQSFIKNVFTDSVSAGATATIQEIDVEIYNGSLVAGLGGRYGEILRSEGLTVTKIETNENDVEKTTIYDGSNGSSALGLVKKQFPGAEIATFSQKNTIKIVIGKDYGS